ncbi:hypothetical protein ACJX0J_006219, partial [Zea mays]
MAKFRRLGRKPTKVKLTYFGIPTRITVANVSVCVSLRSTYTLWNNMMTLPVRHVMLNDTIYTIDCHLNYTSW